MINNIKCLCPVMIRNPILHATKLDLASGFSESSCSECYSQQSLAIWGHAWHGITCTLILVINTYFIIIIIICACVSRHNLHIEYWWKMRGCSSCWMRVPFKPYKHQLKNFHWLQSLLDKLSSAKYWTYFQQIILENEIERWDEIQRCL